MEVRAKKALGQHFLTDQNIAKSIVAALQLPAAGGKAVASEGKVNAYVTPMKVLEIGPGMGVLSQYLLQRKDVDLRMIEIDDESVEYLESHFPQAHGRVIFGDFL